MTFFAIIYCFIKKQKQTSIVACLLLLFYILGVKFDKVHSFKYSHNHENDKNTPGFF